MGSEACRKVVSRGPQSSVGTSQGHSPTSILPALLLPLHSSLGSAGWKGGAGPLSGAVQTSRKQAVVWGPV